MKKQGVAVKEVDLLIGEEGAVTVTLEGKTVTEDVTYTVVLMTNLLLLQLLKKEKLLELMKELQMLQFHSQEQTVPYLK